MELQALKSDAYAFFEAEKYEEASKLYAQVWQHEKIPLNGLMLLKSLRKSDQYSQAREFLSLLLSKYPSNLRIINESLWLDYSEKIKDQDNLNLINDAETLISKCNKNDKYTGLIYNKTIILIVQYFISKNNFKKAWEWILKLDHWFIDNKTRMFKEKIIPSDRKKYFVFFTQILIHTQKHEEYLDKCLIKLNFSENQRKKFYDYYIKDIKNFKNEIISSKLIKHIKNLKEEIHLRRDGVKRTYYRNDKTMLISDLSHYLFCPVSYAINETYRVDAGMRMEKNEFADDMRLFIDRHKIYEKTKNFSKCFDDSSLIVDNGIKNDFGYFFNSYIKVNNATNPNPTIYSNRNNSLKGVPDYIMTDSSGIDYAITEKFSYLKKDEPKRLYESDLIKHYAFLDELENLNLAYGYFITWYWRMEIDPNEKREYFDKKKDVYTYNIFKIERKNEYSKILQETIKEVNQFRQNKTLKVDISEIAYPGKCLNCSYQSFCNIKGGRFSSISLPYNLFDVKLNDSVKFSISA